MTVGWMIDWAVWVVEVVDVFALVAPVATLCGLLYFLPTLVIIASVALHVAPVAMFAHHLAVDMQQALVM
eukprot:4358-Eustigmatos_ZCMA.PRE.1